MIGTKLYKQDLNVIEYEKTSTWCNENNAMIVDKGVYFEVVSSPKDKEEQTPSLSERLAVLEDAMNTFMEGVATNG